MAAIKAPTELRGRLAQSARSRRETMAEAVAHALDSAEEEEEFWGRARTTMGTAAAQTDLRRESERFSMTPADGLEPEDWSDIL